MHCTIILINTTTNDEEKKDNGKKRQNADEVVSSPSIYVVYQPVHNCLINVVHIYLFIYITLCT